MFVTSDHSPCSATVDTLYFESFADGSLSSYGSIGFSTFKIGATLSLKVVRGIRSVMMHL